MLTTGTVRLNFEASRDIQFLVEGALHVAANYASIPDIRQLSYIPLDLVRGGQRYRVVKSRRIPINITNRATVPVPIIFSFRIRFGENLEHTTYKVLVVAPDVNVGQTICNVIYPYLTQ